MVSVFSSRSVESTQSVDGTVYVFSSVSVDSTQSVDGTLSVLAVSLLIVPSPLMVPCLF